VGVWAIEVVVTDDVNTDDVPDDVAGCVGLLPHPAIIAAHQAMLVAHQIFLRRRPVIHTPPALSEVEATIAHMMLGMQQTGTFPQGSDGGLTPAFAFG